MTSFWEEHDVNNKVNLKFNRFGQPCGLKTCKLTNVIGYFVKGKTISLGYPNWSKVPKASKEKLWASVKEFFNIDEPYKPWVLKSASKKWKDFKVVLKKKFFKSNLSTRRNIANGCGQRIPIEQWEWLVKYWKTDRAKAKSKKLKANRASQDNGKHTAGSRSFAYVLDQKELKEGRQVGRAELYRITHTKKDGTPVDTYSGAKIVEIDKALDADPSLIGEEARDGDLYSTVFPDSKKGRFGLGLLAGGAASKQLAEALAHLEEVTKENKELRVVVDKLVQSQTSVVAQNDRMEQQYNELKTMFLSYMGSQPAERVPEKNPSIDDNSKDLGRTNDREHATSLSSMNKRKENVSQVAMQSVKKVHNVNTYIEKMKNATKTNVEQESVVQTSMKAVEHDKPRKFQTLVDVDGSEGIMKRGMEVGLTSPNSAKIVALGTIQGTDPNTKAMDGHPLADSVEVVVDYIFNQKTVLPRAQGKLKMLGHAQARCIPWPRLNVVRKYGTPLHSNVILDANGTALQSKVPLNNKGNLKNKENVDPKSTTSQTEVQVVEKKLDKSSNAKAATTSGCGLSQTERVPPGKDRPPRNLGPGCSQSPYAKVYDNNVYMTTSRLQQTKAKRGLGSQM